MVKFITNNDDLIQSKVISFLRFPMIVGVVLIHCQLSLINGIKGDMSLTYPFGDDFPFYQAIFYIVSEIIARISVPLFFFFSGFLFFYKLETFNASIYLQKLKKRVRSLFIPYIIWNVFFIISYDLTSILFPGSVESFIGLEYSLKDWLMQFWDSNNTTCPVSYQFWFIRDLMIVVLFSPLIYILINYGKLFLPILLFILWLLGLGISTPGLKIDAFCFFTLGAFCSISKINFVNKVRPYKVLLGILYIVLVLLTFITKNCEWGIYLKRASIIVGLCFFVSLTAFCVATGKWRVNNYLTECSFFIFAYHIIALPIIRKIIYAICPPKSDLQATIIYFLWAAIAILLGLGLYYVFKKYIPRITSIITGGR